MTFQDPDNGARASERFARAAEEVAWTPILLAVACIGVVVLLMLGWPQRSDRPAPSQRSELPNTAPNAPSIPAPAPPTPR